MMDLIRVDNVPASLAVNFDELRAALEKQVAQYDVVVTAETVGDAKKLATELNKTKAEISRRRKEEVAKASEPVKQFDAQMKELEGLCEEGRQKLLTQVQRFEDETRQLARQLLREKRQELWDKHGVEAEFRRAEIDDLVKLTAVTPKGNLAAAARSSLETRVLDDKALQDRTSMRILALENASYKAGLAAPLTRDHVQHFLFADDETYERELQRILDAEVQRQEAAERRMREQMEREQRQKEQAEATQKAREERAQRHEQEEAERRSTGKCDGNHGGGRCADPECWNDEAKPEAQAPACAVRGKANWSVSCTFSITTPDHITEGQVEAELRRMLEKAGFRTLDGVIIQRYNEAA